MINKIDIIKYANNKLSAQEDAVIKEHRANIFVNGEHYISLMCLPQYLDELAVGFLFAEKVISSYADVVKIDAADAENIFVTVSHSADTSKTANRAIVSGFTQGSVNLPFFDCGNLPLLNSRLNISADEVIKMTALFNQRSELFRQTGAVHSCSLILPDGTNLFYEDIGRHNAVDKIIGKALIAGLDIKNSILLTSGRISSEILIKAAGLGIPIIISTSAPTSMAVEIARKINLTLLGFARGGRFNIYAGESRIRAAAQPEC